MPAKRELTMRQIRQMLRLARDGVSAREIGRTLGIARSTVQDNLKRAAAAGLTWPLPAELTDAVLEQRLFARAGVKHGLRRRPEPDWAALVREMKRPGVNLMVLWEEYRAGPSGRLRLLAGSATSSASSSAGCRRSCASTMPPATRSSSTTPARSSAIVDPATGVVREAEIFVAVLGASNLTYAEATWTQALPDWIGAHVRLFRFLGGVPRLVVPDNLKSGRPQGLVLRSRAQPQLRHDGRALRRRRPAGPAAQAARQGQGRGRRALRPELHPGTAAPPDLLLAGRGQRRHRRDAWSASTPTSCAGSASPAAHLFETSSGRRCAPLPDEDYEFAEWRLARVGARLPRRGRRLLLLGAPRPDPRAGRRPRHQPHGRGVPSRPARRRPPAPLRRPPARHRSRSHAQRASALRRLDARALPALGARRSGPRPRGWSSPSWPTGPIPSRASAPAWASCACSAISIPAGPRRSRPAPSRSARSPTRASPRSSPTASTAGPAGRGRRRHRPSQPARPRLLPLKETTHADPSHPRSAARARPARHGQGLQGRSTPNPRPAPSITPNGSACCSTTRRRCAGRSASRARARAARLRHPASIEDVDLPRRPRPRPRRSSSSSPPATGSATRRNLLITGPCGVGKSWLACALGHKACREDLSVAYHRVPRLFAALALARGDGRYARLLRAARHGSTC